MPESGQLPDLFQFHGIAVRIKAGREPGNVEQQQRLQSFGFRIAQRAVKQLLIENKGLLAKLPAMLVAFTENKVNNFVHHRKPFL